MTTNFTATNGLIITPHPDGSIRWEGGHPPRFVTAWDKELGRWRDPEAPHMVVYRIRKWDDTDGKCIRVMDERDCTSEVLWERGTRYESDTHTTAARYFAAHPEKKPWHDAKTGEVWAVTVVGETNPCHTNGDGDFTPCLGSDWATIANGSHRIDHATRIWPEESRDE